MTEDRTNESDSNFVRGYVTAVAQVARWNGQVNPADLLAAANITRSVAIRSNVSQFEIEILDDHAGAWPKRGQGRN